VSTVAARSRRCRHTGGAGGIRRRRAQNLAPSVPRIDIGTAARTGRSKRRRSSCRSGACPGCWHRPRRCRKRLGSPTISHFHPSTRRLSWSPRELAQYARASFPPTGAGVLRPGSIAPRAAAHRLGLAT
jgi:hypothetical protein